MAKAGRKRKVGVKRVNGRISQRKDDVIVRKAETEAEVTATAREARTRVFGVDKLDTMNPDTGTVVGRLKRAKVINAGQLKAAYRYEACVMSYRTAVCAPAVRGNTDMSGGTASEYLSNEVDRHKRAIARYEGAARALLDENALHKHRGSNFPAALDTIVMRDVDVPHMHGDLRLALNALAHYFGCIEEEDLPASRAA